MVALDLIATFIVSDLGRPLLVIYERRTMYFSTLFTLLTSDIRGNVNAHSTRSQPRRLLGRSTAFGASSSRMQEGAFILPL